MHLKLFLLQEYYAKLAAKCDVNENVASKPSLSNTRTTSLEISGLFCSNLCIDEADKCQSVA